MHKEIVNTKTKINIVKEIGKKIKDQMLRDNSEMMANYGKPEGKGKKRRKKNELGRIVMQEDIDLLKDDIKELEAERDHLSAINDIDK